MILNKTRRLFWALFLLCLLGIWYLISNWLPEIVVTYGDTVQYWAAGQLSLRGENQHAADGVLKLRAEAGAQTDFTVGAVSIFLYPPWTLPFLLLFGALDYESCQLLWILFHYVILLVSPLGWSYYYFYSLSHSL